LIFIKKYYMLRNNAIGGAMKLKDELVTYCLIFMLFVLSGCAFASGAAFGTAAGFTGGYLLRDHGYEIRDPIAKQ
jgi:hypothetical protein